MDYRQYSSGDLPAFSDLVTHYYLEDLGAPFSEEQVRATAVDQFSRLAQRGAAPIVLAVHEDTPVGFVIFQIDSPGSDWNDRPGWGFVRELYVAPTFRGQGVGSTLLAIAAQVLSESGAQDAYALATPDSLGFWERAGWAAQEAADTNTAGSIVVTTRLPPRVPGNDA